MVNLIIFETPGQEGRALATLGTYNSIHMKSNAFIALWAGYIRRIYPECTLELNQSLGPLCFVYRAESPQDWK